MKKIIMEVGSTNTKIDTYDGKEVKRLEEITILLKQNAKKNNNKIDPEDFEKLKNKANELKEKCNDVYVFGTSVFRALESGYKKEFCDLFYKETGLTFHILDQEDENYYTVLGATRKVKDKVCVFVGGGGSTEITIFDKKLKECKNTSIGVMDVMNQFPDLADDIAKTPLETVMNYIEERLNLPDGEADTLILAGGGHEVFARNSGVSYEENTLYKDNIAPIMMDIETRRKETKRYFEEISLEEIKSRVSNPDWWFATRAMCAFVLVVANKIKAKYVVPTNISVVYGLLDERKRI